MDHPDPRYAGSLGPAQAPVQSTFGAVPPAPAAPAGAFAPEAGYARLPQPALPAPVPAPSPSRKGKTPLAIVAMLVFGGLAVLKLGSFGLAILNESRDVSMPASAAGRPNTTGSNQAMVDDLIRSLDPQATHPRAATYGTEPLVVVAFRNRVDVQGEWKDGGMAEVESRTYGDTACRNADGLRLCINSGLTLSVEAAAADTLAITDAELVQAIKDVQAAN